MITEQSTEYTYAMLPALLLSLAGGQRNPNLLARFLARALNELTHREEVLADKERRYTALIRRRGERLLINSCLECEKRWLQCAFAALKHLENYQTHGHTFYLGFCLQDFHAGEHHFDQLLRLRTTLPGGWAEHPLDRVA